MNCLRIIFTCWMYVSTSVRPGRLGDVPRVRRSGALMPASVSMQSLKNASIMICSDALNQQMARMVELSDEQLKGVFNDKGGNYVKEYMAATETEAQLNFPDMLEMTKPVTVEGSSSPFTDADNSIMKDVILKDLIKLTEYFQSKNKSSNETDAPAPDIHSETTSTSAPSPDVYSGTSAGPIPGQVNESSQLSTLHSARPDTSRPTPGQVTPSTTLEPDVANSLNQLQQYVLGNLFHNNSRRDLERVWREANTTLHPARLMNLTVGREKRFLSSTDGSSTIEDYCHVRGTHTEDDRYVHLCSICAATTRLADDFFPRYINEAICKTGDTDCFSIAGTAHGQCKQTRFSLHIMRRKPETCRMLLHDGEALVFDDWELVPTWIRVSCECTINKLSTFSRFAGNQEMVG